MHPAMALWMWSMVMCRIWQATLMGKEYRPEDDFLPAKAAPLFVRANAYLISDLANHPLPDSLLGSTLRSLLDGERSRTRDLILWLKVKTAAWRAANRDRWEMFERG